MLSTLYHYKYALSKKNYIITLYLYSPLSPPGLAKRAATADQQLHRWNQLLDVQRSLGAAITAASDRLRQLDASPSTRRRAVDTRHALQVRYYKY